MSMQKACSRQVKTRGPVKEQPKQQNPPLRITPRASSKTHKTRPLAGAVKSSPQCAPDQALSRPLNSPHEPPTSRQDPPAATSAIVPALSAGSVRQPEASPPMQQTPQIQLTAVVAAASVKPARLNQVEASKAAAGQVLSISACCRQLHTAGAAASVCMRSGKLTNISAADINPVSLRKKIRELRETGQLLEPEPEPGEGGGHAAERP